MMTLEQIRATIDPSELAQIDAECLAMEQFANTYERMLVPELAAIKAFMKSEAAVELLMAVACVIALEQLRSAALGCATSTWQEALERNHILSGSTVEQIKRTFQREATT
jgi:hypothetical protein